jgi:hypothetical protein
LRIEEVKKSRSQEVPATLIPSLPVDLAESQTRVNDVWQHLTEHFPARRRSAMLSQGFRKVIVATGGMKMD